MHTDKLNLRQKAKDERQKARSGRVLKFGFLSPYLLNLWLNSYREPYGHDQ